MLFPRLAIFCASIFSFSYSMEEQVVVVTKEDLKYYLNDGIYGSDDSCALRRTKLVYEMLFAKNLEDLIDAMGAVAHMVPIIIQIPTINGKALFFKSPADICSFLLARVKKKNELDIETVFLPDYEIYLKFYRAYIKHNTHEAADLEDFSERADLCDFVVSVLDKKTVFI